MNDTQTRVEPQTDSESSQEAQWADLRQMLGDEARILADLREVQLKRLQSRLPRAFVDSGSSIAPPTLGTNPEHECLGLALSGGGIRSATFCLGVIQALAQRKRIASIDYLSTVSGGGYIGAWLSACIFRAGRAKRDDPVDYVEQRIAPHTRFAAEEATEIRFLRAYSNYLTPRLGLFSGDTMAALSGLLRNLSLNLVLGMLCILFAVAVPHAILAVLALYLALVPGDIERFGSGTLVTLLASFTALSLSLTLQSYDVRAFEDSKKKETLMRVFRWSRPIAVSLLGISLIFGSLWICLNARSFGLAQIFLVVLAATIGMGLGGVCAYVLLHILRPASEGTKLLALLYASLRTAIHDSRKELGRYLFAVAACGFATYVLANLGSSALKLSELDTKSLIHIVALGPAVGVVFIWFLFVLWTGIVGNKYSEFTREWLNRYLGELSGLAAIWMVVGGLMIHARPAWLWAITNAGGLIRPYPLFSIAGVTLSIAFAGVVGWLLWKRRGSRTRKPEPETRRPAVMILCWTLIGTSVFLTTVFFQEFLLFDLGRRHLEATSGTTYSDILKNQIAHLEFALTARAPAWLDPASWPLSSPAIAMFLFVSLLALFSFACVDVNTFSLQNLYRNRLVRCYLGAAHGPGRLPNPYAGFDPSDDFALSELADQRPYLLVNTALNITQGQDLAWQQRKAAAFLLSPRWCGYWLESAERSGVVATDASRGGYVQTENYVREFGGFRSESKGIMIGTAIATSGAAVSSQMGFASRGPLAFVLTLLNLRLGRWFPNTAKLVDYSAERSEAAWKKASPGFGALWYLSELSGVTNEKSSWVYVSDGGHFENLGIYELVRRRCTRIFCVDAGADPERTFSDLGNAVQKCRVDFGVDIRIDLGRLQLDADGRSRDAHSIGTIDYPATAEDKGFQGELVYLKPSLPSTWAYLPTDVLAYRARHPEFPHEATTNQWFSESQFESYRQLGYVIGLRALSATDGWRGPRSKVKTSEREPAAREDEVPL